MSVFDLEENFCLNPSFVTWHFQVSPFSSRGVKTFKEVQKPKKNFFLVYFKTYMPYIRKRKYGYKIWETTENKLCSLATRKDVKSGVPYTAWNILENKVAYWFNYSWHLRPSRWRRSVCWKISLGTGSSGNKMGQEMELYLTVISHGPTSYFPFVSRHCICQVEVAMLGEECSLP